MKLYHATPNENIDSINEYGLCPTDCGNKAVDPSMGTLQGNGHNGIYGFLKIEDAQLFARDNDYGAIYEFETDDSHTIDDPEYPGEAKFYSVDKYVAAKLIENRGW